MIFCDENHHESRCLLKKQADATPWREGIAERETHLRAAHASACVSGLTIVTN